MPSVSFLHSLNSIKHHTGADPNLPDCNGHTPQLLWQKASPSPISAPTSPSSPSSERIPRTPTTPQYAALDWSHHSGEGECRGAPSVQHTTLRPDSPEVTVANERFFLQIVHILIYEAAGCSDSLLDKRRRRVEKTVGSLSYCDTRASSQQVLITSFF